jgi:hypothetical protein
MKNPFENKTSEEVLEMFLQSPSEETKKMNMYMSAIHVKSAQEVKEMISDVKKTISDFTQVVKKYTDASNHSGRNMFWLTVVLAIAALIQALSAFAQWKVSEAAIEVQREGNGNVYAQWQYEISHNDFEDSRAVDWRRTDLEAQGRLP